jgi:hypothetical protein
LATSRHRRSGRDLGAQAAHRVGQSGAAAPFYRCAARRLSGLDLCTSNLIGPGLVQRSCAAATLHDDPTGCIDSHAKRPRPSIEIAIPAASSLLVNAALMNCAA